MTTKGIAGLVIRQAVELAVAAERARCAKVCRDIARAYLDDINGAGFPRHSGAYSVADGCANAIDRGPVTP